MSRFIRQADLVPESLQTKKILIAGVGAGGRNHALSLAAMGAKHVKIIDFDLIEPHNICTQGWRSKDMGRPKVEALLEEMYELDHEGDANFTSRNGPYDPDEDGDADIILIGVDNMTARFSIFKQFQRGTSELLVDGRMAGENLRWLAVDRDSQNIFEKSLFKDEDAVQGRCTSQGSLYISKILSSLMIGEVSMHLRGYKRSTDKILNLLDLQL